MRVWIDCEFNGFEGDLISMALVPEDDGPIFYEVLDCADPVPWVVENVMTVLRKAPITHEEFQVKLQEWLKKYETVHIIADWPDDIKYFCQTVITGPGQRIHMPHVTMEIDHSIEAEGLIPHNALEDALANSNWCMNREDSLNEATELKYLTWFKQNADFGPADGDVQMIMDEDFEKATGKRVPEKWRIEDDEEDE